MTDSGLIITNGQGERRLLEADTIVLAGGVKKNTELMKALEGKAREIHGVGDCLEPCGIPEAIADGSRVGRVI